MKNLVNSINEGTEKVEIKGEVAGVGKSITATKTTLMEIFNRHISEEAKITSYEHPGCHMINKEIMQAIANEIVDNIKAGTLRTDDLKFRLDYNKPESKSGNTKLKGIIYIASHPLIDCYLDGLDRQKPSCTGLLHWCYVFSDFFYKSFGKQLSMFANSIMYILEPERTKEEIMAWLRKTRKKFVADKNGHVALRIDEAGDITNCLPMWLSIAKELATEMPEIVLYAYTKQFEKLNGLDYCINKTFSNFRVLLSDSTKDDPNPISQVREDYGSFAIKFKDDNLTPDSIIALSKMAGFGRHKCPGVKMGCFKCTKCSEAETEDTKVIVADEH